MSIKLGDKVQCKITGFTGIAMTKVQHINGCTRWNVQPVVDKDGKIPESYTFDDPQLRVLEPAVIVPEEEPKKKPGGEMRKGRDAL